MTRIIAVAALAAALVVTPAVAQDRTPPTRSQAVSHRDLNLRDVRDVARLDRRLQHTASALCGTASSLDPAGHRADRACVRAALARADRARTAAIASAATTMVAVR